MNVPVLLDRSHWTHPSAHIASPTQTTTTHIPHHLPPHIHPHAHLHVHPSAYATTVPSPSSATVSPSSTGSGSPSSAGFSPQLSSPQLSRSASSGGMFPQLLSPTHSAQQQTFLASAIPAVESGFSSSQHSALSPTSNIIGAPPRVPVPVPLILPSPANKKGGKGKDGGAILHASASHAHLHGPTRAGLESAGLKRRMSLGTVIPGQQQSHQPSASHPHAHVLRSSEDAQHGGGHVGHQNHGPTKASHNATSRNERVTREREHDHQSGGSHGYHPGSQALYKQYQQGRKASSMPASTTISKIGTPMSNSPISGSPRRMVSRVDEARGGMNPRAPLSSHVLSYGSTTAAAVATPAAQPNSTAPTPPVWPDDSQEPAEDVLTPSTSVQPASAAHCVLASLPLYVSAKKRRSYAQHITYCEAGGLVKDNNIGAAPGGSVSKSQSSTSAASSSSTSGPDGLPFAEEHSLIDTSRGWVFQPQRHTQVFKSHFQKKSHQAIFGLFAGFNGDELGSGFEPEDPASAPQTPVTPLSSQQPEEDDNLETLAPSSTKASPSKSPGHTKVPSGTPASPSSPNSSTTTPGTPRLDLATFYAQFFRRYFLAFIDAYFPNLAAVALANGNENIQLDLIPEIKVVVGKMVESMQREAAKVLPKAKKDGCGCSWAVVLISNGMLYEYNSSFVHRSTPPPIAGATSSPTPASSSSSAPNSPKYLSKEAFSVMLCSNGAGIDLTPNPGEETLERVLDPADQFFVISNMQLGRRIETRPTLFGDGTHAIEFLNQYHTPQEAVAKLVEARTKGNNAAVSQVNSLKKPVHGPVQKKPDEMLLMSIVYL